MNENMKSSGIEWIGEIPESWNTKKLKYCLDTPLQYGANESGEDFEETYPRYIRITDITSTNTLKEQGKVSLLPSIAKPYLLQDGDVLFARTGATVGKTFYYDSCYGESAFAGYLEKHFPTITAREDALKTYLRTYCAENAEYNSRGLWIDDFSKSNLSKGNKQKPNFEFDPVPAHYKVKAVNSFLYCKRKQVSFSEIDGEHCSIRPGSRKWTYSLDVKAESVTTWEDHQPWADRFNRNILRNSEIRSALRCKLSKDVPVSCSPLGTSSSVLVQ